MLARMRDRLEEIEASNDRGAMRELVELLVPRIVIQTELLGPTSPRRKRVPARVEVAFGGNGCSRCHQRHRWWI